MEIKTIKKSIDIQAPSEKVWEVIVNNQKNTAWLDEFKEGSRAETDWKEGSKAVFTDGEGMGMFGTIEKSRPHEEIAIEYGGFIANGKEDTESEGAQAFSGTREIYRLTEKNGVTHLDISSDMDDEHYQEMDAAWDRALQKIKAMAEKK